MENHDDSVDVDIESISSSEPDSVDIEMDDDESESGSTADGKESSDEGNVDGDAVARHSKVRFDSMTADDIRSMEFSNLSEAYDFYYRYGKYYGFPIRKSDNRRSKCKTKITMKQYVCNKAGLRDTKHLVRLDRKIEHRRTSRTNCQARFRVKYHAAKGKYVVAIFVEAHNHELTPARFVHLHPLFRNISEADKAQIDGLQSHGIRTCHIMGYMVAQKGGYADVGFTKKDLYNYFDKKKCVLLLKTVMLPLL
jgi:hypothetical protein